MSPTPAFRRVVEKPMTDLAGKWTLHTDGACDPNPGNGGTGFVLTSPDGVVVYEASRGIGQSTNNIAEYQALIDGLQVALTCEVKALVVCSDSQLLVRQMEGRYRVKNPGLKPLYVEAQRLVANFKAVAFQWIPREQNERADALAGLGIGVPLAGMQAMDDHILRIPASAVRAGQRVCLYDWPEIYEVVKVEVSLRLRRSGAEELATSTLSFPCDQEFTLVQD